ncbi:Hint domain-containing protein [Paracoccus xiamenensis]|uniref:Hint domain-containing protein n=1 Tax=Paracoccus xiamenensis TaxID=2714901 RepID=UPI00140D7521|nr:Hint domain-containing protein [Paracoccus xiamenensis]NHF72236.1 hemolysin [Paracoccus xiamenensis]
MALRNIIVNRHFELGVTGWSGTDIEIGRETSYRRPGNPRAHVAEMDGHSGQTTVLEQEVSINFATTRELGFGATTRNTGSPKPGEGMRAEVLDSEGNVIASKDVYPGGKWKSYYLSVPFPAPGKYTVRFTELGIDDGLGALLDGVRLFVCFAGETNIRTPGGTKLAREIEVGDLIATERGPKPVRWVGKRKLSKAEMKAEEKLRPVRISAGALGDGMPKADLTVSRQHRMLIRSPICERMFGTPDALVAAIRLTSLPGVYVDEGAKQVEYVHVLFDEHEIVYAEGAPSESLLLGEQAQKILPPESLEEIRLIFPDLDQKGAKMSTAKLVPENARQTGLAKRLARKAERLAEAC